ncbi:MAG: hypothetical protein FGM37_04455 [Phycisphaerales bacterium]|nr:hypothetical protein [Phycisphaerales bacterium]
MSQYLIIFLIVAVFRGVVWVVQKAKESAKAREALMAQQANAAMGNSTAAGSPGSAATQAAAGAAVPRARSSAAAAATRAERAAQRGQPKRTSRGASVSSRGAVAARGGSRSAGTTAGKRGPAPGIAMTPMTPRPDAPARTAQNRSVAAAQAVVPPSSRAEAREVRVGQSSRDVRKLLLDRTSLRQALLAREILGPPRGITG